MGKYEHTSKTDPTTGRNRTTSQLSGTGIVYILAESLTPGDVVCYMATEHTVADVVRVDGQILVEMQFSRYGKPTSILLSLNPWARFVLAS